MRGIITLGYLQAMEALLARRSGRSDFRLADYFDLVAGTSTGALIATLIALGKTVEEIRTSYTALATEVFQPKRYWGLGPIGRAIGTRFDAQALARVLRAQLGEEALDSALLRTALVIVTKRVDTSSVWPYINAPRSRYFADRSLLDGTISRGNRHMKLWALLRASTAAPTFFHPEHVEEVAPEERAAFIDGGASAHNNPALLALMAATLDGFGLNWPTGPDRLLLCSVGTGAFAKTPPVADVRKFTALHWARILIPQLMGDSMELVETLLQWMAKSPTARPIDGNIGTVGPTLGGPDGLLHYLRYNIGLNGQDLAEVGVHLNPGQIAALHDISNTRGMPQLLEIASRVGVSVSASHFPAGFDAAGSC